MTGPLVSVIVATYRRDAKLKRALDSLDSQSYPNYEIIVVNDNSDIGWKERAHNAVNCFKEKNPDIALKYIEVGNIGSARARNAGIEASTGEYICFLDDDDIYLPERIKNQLAPMLEVNADYSITNLMLYSDSDKLIETRNREYIKDIAPESMLRYHLMHHITGTDTMMFKREYLMKIGCFSPIDVGDEFYLMQKAIEGDGRFVHVPVCDVKAYVHTGEGGLSSGESKIKGENQLFEYKKGFFERLDKKTIRYIKMRHHAVLAFAYLRMRNLPGFFGQAVCSFASSPVSCVKLFLGR